MSGIPDEYLRVVDGIRRAEQSVKLLRIVSQTYAGANTLAPKDVAPLRNLDEIGEEADYARMSSLRLSRWILGLNVESPSEGIEEIKTAIGIKSVTAKRFSRSQIDWCGISAHSLRQVRTVELVFIRTVKSLNESGLVATEVDLDAVKIMDAGKFSELLTEFTVRHPSLRLLERSRETAPDVPDAKDSSPREDNEMVDRNNNGNHEQVEQPLTREDLEQLMAELREGFATNQHVTEVDNRLTTVTDNLVQITTNLAQASANHQDHLERHDREIGAHQADLERIGGNAEDMVVRQNALDEAMTRLANAQTGLTTTVTTLTTQVDEHNNQSIARDAVINTRINTLNVHSQTLGRRLLIATGIIAGSILFGLLMGILASLFDVGVVLSGMNWPWIGILVIGGIGAIVATIYLTTYFARPRRNGANNPTEQLPAAQR